MLQESSPHALHTARRLARIAARSTTGGKLSTVTPCGQAEQLGQMVEQLQTMVGGSSRRAGSADFKADKGHAKMPHGDKIRHKPAAKATGEFPYGAEELIPLEEEELAKF